MDTSQQLVFGILAATVALFASGRARFDAVALLAVLALMLTEILTPAEALAGFGDPVVILVGALMIVGGALTRTGVAHRIGLWLVGKAAGNESKVVALLMASAALLSGVMSSTAVVAIFIPIVFTVAKRTSLAPSHLLMPLSFAALLGGTLTLIATPPNIIVSESLAAAGEEPLHFFSLFPIGAVLVAIGVLYFLTVGRSLLPSREAAKDAPDGPAAAALLERFDLAGRGRRYELLEGSSLAGVTIADSGLAEAGLRVLGIEREETIAQRLPKPARAIAEFGDRLGGGAAAPRLASYVVSVGATTELRRGDVLACIAEVGADDPPDPAWRFSSLSVDPSRMEAWRQRMGIAEVLVHPESRMKGQSIAGSELRSRHGVHVLGVRRSDEVLEDFAERPLRASDTLLVQGPWSRIAKLPGVNQDFVLLTLPQEIDEISPAPGRAPLSLLVLLAMALAATLSSVPLVAVVLIAALAMVGTRCLSMEDAYRGIHWSSLVVLAGMIPLATALEKTGGTTLIVNAMVEMGAGLDPRILMSVLFFVTVAIGLFISNTATSILMTPIAIQLALMVGVSPRAFAVAVALGASAVFISPVSTPVITLVVEPGRYRFVDFIKVGTPLLLATWLVTIFLVPLLFPL